MPVTSDDVKTLAILSRIALPPSAMDATLQRLNSVLGLIDEMQAIDTTGIAPMTHAQEMVLRLRDDKVTEVNRRDEYQALAPAVAQGLYLVPKVIE